MCKLLVDIHRLMKLHVTCYFTMNQHKSKYLLLYIYMYIYLKEMHICLLNDISIMHYVQFGSKKLWCFRPLLCTLFRLNWAKQTPGIMRRN